MSSLRWSGNNTLVQRVKGHEEELGHIERDQSSGKCVLWLKDSFGVASTAGSNIRAEEYPSLEVAKDRALTAPSVFIWHVIWMRNVLKREAEKELEVYWEQLSAGGTVASKQGSKDCLRGYLDRLPIDEAMSLFKKIGSEVFKQSIIEIIKKLFD